MLPTDKQARKEVPVTTGFLDYFPDAIAAVAHVSFVGNKQHNPGEPMHWARHKSTDQSDCIARHLLQRGTIDDDGLRHSAKLAWRALAMLQLEIEADQKAEASQPSTPTIEQPSCDCITVDGGTADCKNLPNCGLNYPQYFRTKAVINGLYRLDGPGKALILLGRGTEYLGESCYTLADLGKDLITGAAWQCDDQGVIL